MNKNIEFTRMLEKHYEFNQPTDLFMFTFRSIIPVNGCNHFSYCDNYAYFLSSNGIVISQFPIQFPAKDGYVVNNKQVMFSSQMYSAVIARGKCYICHLGIVYEAQGDKLSQIFTIPHFSQDWLESGLFSHDNKVYMSDNNLSNGIVYNVETGEKSSNLSGMFFFTWADITIKYYPGNKIMKLIGEKEVLLCLLRPEMRQFSFCQGGICIIGNTDESRIIIINLLRLEAKEAPDARLTQTEIRHYLQVSEYGLTLAPEILDSYFPEYTVERNKYMENFYKKQLKYVPENKNQELRPGIMSDVKREGVTLDRMAGAEGASLNTDIIKRYCDVENAVAVAKTGKINETPLLNSAIFREKEIKENAQFEDAIGLIESKNLQDYSNTQALSNQLATVNSHQFQIVNGKQVENQKSDVSQVVQVQQKPIQQNIQKILQDVYIQNSAVQSIRVEMGKFNNINSLLVTENSKVVQIESQVKIEMKDNQQLNQKSMYQIIDNNLRQNSIEQKMAELDSRMQKVEGKVEESVQVMKQFEEQFVKAVSELAQLTRVCNAAFSK